MMKKILLALTIFFFTGMLFLTFFSETIHNASLPKVTVARPEQKLFPHKYTNEKGELQMVVLEKIAVPKAILENGIYITYSAEKNGTNRNFVQLIPVQTGEEKDGYVEIISGIMLFDQIVINSTVELFDGCEVTVR